MTCATIADNGKQDEHTGNACRRFARISACIENEKEIGKLKTMH